MLADGYCKDVRTALISTQTEPQFIVKGGKRLRCGFTTGTCAAVAAQAAACLLLTGEPLGRVSLVVPAGYELCVPVARVSLSDAGAVACVVKDGGDDPDVTHGMEICVEVSLCDSGVTIEGGPGVGRVTKSGLPCAVGGPAINPTPRVMIEAALEKSARAAHYAGGFTCVVFAPEGQQRAKKTFNARLGIENGISILGTTGVVEPMSETALIESIRLEINQKKSQRVLFIAPGNYGLDYARDTWGLGMNDAVKCSNFLGETLDYARYVGCTKILLVGHIGKLLKVAGGAMNTHSKVADCRAETFVAHAACAGVSAELLQQLFDAPTTDEMHSLLLSCGSDTVDRVYASLAEKLAFHLGYRTQNEIEIEFIVFSQVHGTLMKSEHAERFVNMVKEN